MILWLFYSSPFGGGRGEDRPANPFFSLKLLLPRSDVKLYARSPHFPLWRGTQGEDLTNHFFSLHPAHELHVKSAFQHTHNSALPLLH